jgi:hypothetical protein
LKPNVKIFENPLPPPTIQNSHPIITPPSRIQNSHLTIPPPLPEPIVNNKVVTTHVGKTEIKQESLEYTLPALPIDSRHKIDYYYPYFYKTHVIEYYDNIDMSNLTNNCIELGCEWCTITNNLICKQCRHGYYLFDNKCYSVCPMNYVADIFKRVCHHVDITSKIIFYYYYRHIDSSFISKSFHCWIM